MPGFLKRPAGIVLEAPPWRSLATWAGPKSRGLRIRPDGGSEGKKGIRLALGGGHRPHFATAAPGPSGGRLGIHRQVHFYPRSGLQNRKVGLLIIFPSAVFVTGGLVMELAQLSPNLGLS
jgi:hypothetical protein